MKILTNKQQKEALSIITDIRHVLCTGSDMEKLEVIEELVKLTDILGGIKGLEAELARIRFETTIGGRE